MPKFGGHIVIGEEVGRRLGYTQDDMNGEIGKALRLGAVGPDLMLFLMDPAQDNQFLYEALGSGMRVYREIRKIRDKLEEVQNYIGKPVSEIAGWISGGFSDSLLEFTGLAVHSFTSALKMVAFSRTKVEVINPFQGMDLDLLRRIFGPDVMKWATLPQIDVSWNLDSDQVTSPAYIFRYFGAPYSDDPPFKKPAQAGDYSEWWWMDILHYRRTAPFAAKLLANATAIGDPILIAYARGYFSHVGGDIVGHPYVNSLVGGPFRNHALRHMVIESLMDVRIWKDRKNQEIFNSRLDKLVEVSDGSIRSIANLFHQTLTEVFVAPVTGEPPIATKHFSRAAPSADDIITAHTTMLGYLGFSTDIGLERPQMPPGNLGEVWDEIRERLQNSIDKINQYTHDLGSSSGWNWFAALIGLVMWSAVLVTQLLTLPTALVNQILALKPRWYFYLINSALYDFVSNVRYTMALSGWGYAGSEDLGRSKSVQLLSIRREISEWYPAAMTRRVDGFWLEHPIDLNTPIEQARTLAGPYQTGHGPDTFIDAMPFDAANRNALEELAFPPPHTNEAWTTARLHDIQQVNPTTAFLGNAVDFTCELIKGNFPAGSFDLDGDRGYASMQWENYPPGTEYLP